MRFFRRGENGGAATAGTPIITEPTNEVEAATPAPARGGATTTTSILRDLLIVTYAVPAGRVAGILPDGLPADVLPGADGELVAFVQTVCAFHENSRWSPLPDGAGRSFHQASYRILTRREKRRSAFEWRTFVSTSETHAAKRTLDNHADYARFSFFIDGDPARASYRRYTIRAVGDLGKTELEVCALPEPPPVPAPFGSLADMTDFLTRRDDYYADAPLLKTRYALTAQTHDLLNPVYAELTAAKLTPFTLAGVLTAQEALTPLCVLLQPSLTIYSRPPRLVKF